MKKLFFSIVMATIVICGYTVEAKGKMIYTVSPSGRADFHTIQEGVDRVPDGATLLIKKGTYNEKVQIQNKTVNIVGESRDDCILQFQNDRYFDAPLVIAGGKVENLTIYGYTTHEGGWLSRYVSVDEDYINCFETDLERRASVFEGYTVHIEQNYLAGRTLEFKNCEIVSENSHCVGAGLRAGCHLIFNGCTFKAYSLYGGNLFVHDDSYGTKVEECDVTLKDCELYNYNCGHFLAMHSYQMENTVFMHFINNKVHTAAYDINSTNNQYLGCSVNEMNQMDISDSLVENGYCSNDLVFCLDKSQSDAKYQHEILGMPSELPEGVTVIWKGRSLEESKPFFPIEVFNSNGMEDGKWLNTACFELAPDSAGNTFAQMNYPYRQ